MNRPPISTAGPPVKTYCAILGEWDECLPLQLLGDDRIVYVGARTLEAWANKARGNGNATEETEHP